mmetsp:Transcript_78352/g.176989  ORF Transcript_78352/g.176989 Transcript_78352/m.176989 type:complete len:410 (-) Transcript_78352:139-1368(-)
MFFKGFPPAAKGACKGGKAGLEEEDRSRDWYCFKCRERNFVKRTECFKCKVPKPKDVDCSAPPRPVLPQSGTTMNGMVKSFNRKGFGFLMCFGIEHCSDIHYTRENLSPKLQTRDIPGQHVTFEIHRSPDGKLAALNIRPLGEEKESNSGPKGKAAGRDASSAAKPATSGRDEEDRSRDWQCTSCGERNFVKRFDCFKCKKIRSVGFEEAPAGAVPEPRRTVSPHAGSRAWREAYAAAAAGSGSSRSRGRGRRRPPPPKRRRSRSRSSRDSSSSSLSRQKKRKRRRSRSHSSRKGRKAGRRASSSSNSSDCKMEDPVGGTSGSARPEVVAAAVAALRSQSSGSSEVEKAKAEALEEMMKLRSLETKEARMTEFRALLRKWHPDKNPDRVEVATTVFQFLQKGKPVLDAA